MIDRRNKPRVSCDCEARVRSYDERNGHSAPDLAGRVMNLSAEGLYLRLNDQVDVKPGDELLVVFTFAAEPNPMGPAPKIAARGQVVRTERQDDGTLGLGLRLLHYRFL